MHVSARTARIDMGPGQVRWKPSMKSLSGRCCIALWSLWCHFWFVLLMLLFGQGSGTNLGPITLQWKWTIYIWFTYSNSDFPWLCSFTTGYELTFRMDLGLFSAAGFTSISPRAPHCSPSGWKETWLEKAPVIFLLLGSTHFSCQLNRLAIDHRWSQRLLAIQRHRVLSHKSNLS